MRTLIAQAWQRLNSRTIGTDLYWSIALQNASLYANTEPLIARYVSGRTLDIGAGKLAWRSTLKRHCERYLSGDLTREHRNIDVLFDATKPFPFADESFDTLFCHSVLEHCQEPWNALPEMWRTLTPGGVAIVSVPFVFYLHGQPHDYYRFSRYGLSYLARRAGFEVTEVVIDGGIVHLILNVPSVLLSSLLSALGLTRLVRPVTRFWLSVARGLSGRLDQDGLFAMNHIAVLRKPAT
ncbi:MAG: methyltransferase domain-containing protein [Chloroflexia bacterium]